MAFLNNGTIATTAPVPLHFPSSSIGSPYALPSAIPALSASTISSGVLPHHHSTITTSPAPYGKGQHEWAMQAHQASASMAREAMVTVAGLLLFTGTKFPLLDNETISSTPYPPLSALLSAALQQYENKLYVENYTENGTNASTTPEPSGTYYDMPQTVIIALVAGFLSLVTVLGNFMVMISFKMDKQLQTISNYFLLSLAVADFAIGSISMPLHTVYLLLGYWPFGPLMCDTWLALDYLASNASVLNLLIISFDRYFSVTRPLTYRARRTTKRACFMISSAWIISLILWPPWIYSWPYIEGERTVESDQCYIQFLKTNLYITFGTAIAAFYIPVSVMCVLYWQIWRETEQRQKDLNNLQAVKKDNSKRSTSSDDVVEQEEVVANKRSRSDSSAAPATEEIETTYVPTAMCMENTRYLKVPGRTKQRNLTEVLCHACLKYCKIEIDREPEYVEEDSTSDAGHGSPGNTTPASVETPVQSAVSRCTSLTFRTETQTAVTQAVALSSRNTRMDSNMIPLLDRPTGNGVRGGTIASTPLAAPTAPRLVLPARSHSSDSVYTILIRLPLDNVPGDEQPSIQMIAEEEDEGKPRQAETALQKSPRFERGTSPGSEASVVNPNAPAAAAPAGGGDFSLNPAGCSAPTTCTPSSMRRISQPPETIKLPLNTKLVPKQVMTKAAKKKKKKTQERKQDRKAAKTLSAILLAFIITWTPYNVMVLINTVATCGGDECIPKVLWDMVYYLCYINSTVNPLCYALCNASFRRTYVRILTCKWHTKKRNPNRGFYN